MRRADMGHERAAVRRWFGPPALTVALLVLGMPRHAHAAEPLLRFEWSAPAGCPTREQVLSHAEKLLGRAPDAALSMPLSLLATVTRADSGAFQLELRSRSETSNVERSVSAENCAELADAAALLLALAIDPTLKSDERKTSGAFASDDSPATTTATTKPPPEPAPEPAAQPEPAPSSVGAGATTIAPAVPVRGLAAVALALWSRRLPGVAPGALVSGGMARGAWSLRANLGFFPKQHAGVKDSSAGGDVQLGSFGVELGYTMVSDNVGLTPRGGLELGWMHGSGGGVAHPGSADLLLLGFDAGGRASLQVSRSWSVFGEGLVSALAKRPRFVLDGVGVVHQPEELALRFGLGAEWRQP